MFEKIKKHKKAIGYACITVGVAMVTSALTRIVVTRQCNVGLNQMRETAEGAGVLDKLIAYETAQK